VPAALLVNRDCACRSQRKRQARRTSNTGKPQALSRQYSSFVCLDRMEYFSHARTGWNSRPCVCGTVCADFNSVLFAGSFLRVRGPQTL
jgi:hypothetical protein